MDRNILKIGKKYMEKDTIFIPGFFKSNFGDQSRAYNLSLIVCLSEVTAN